MAIQPTRQVRRSVSHRWDKDLNKVLSRNRKVKEAQAQYKIWDRQSDIYLLISELISIKTWVSKEKLPKRYKEAKDNIKRFNQWWGDFTISEKLHISQCVFCNDPTKRFEDYSLERTML